MPRGRKRRPPRASTSPPGILQVRVARPARLRTDAAGAPRPASSASPVPRQRHRSRIANGNRFHREQIRAILDRKLGDVGAGAETLGEERRRHGAVNAGCEEMGCPGEVVRRHAKDEPRRQPVLPAVASGQDVPEQKIPGQEMGRLNEEARMTIKVLDERGATGAGIARLLGVSEGAVRHHVRRMKVGAADGRCAQPQKAAAFADAIEHWRQSTSDTGLNLAAPHSWLEHEHGYGGSLRSVQRFWKRTYPATRIRARRRGESSPRGRHRSEDHGGRARSSDGYAISATGSIPAPAASRRLRSCKPGQTSRSRRATMTGVALPRVRPSPRQGRRRSGG